MATTKLVCKLTDTATGTAVYESNITNDIDGIILPKDKLQANKEYKIEIFKNRVDNATMFDLMLSGTFSTSAWKIESPTSLPWESITNKPNFDNKYLTSNDIANLVTIEDLKTTATKQSVDDLATEVETLKTSGGSGGSINTAALQQALKDFTYNKENIDKKFAQVGGLSGANEYLTLHKLREIFENMGMIIPKTKEELIAEGYRGHNSIKIVYDLERGGQYGPVVQLLEIFLKDNKKLYLRYATPNDTSTTDWDVIFTTKPENATENSGTDIPKIPANYLLQLGDIRGKLVVTHRYVNGNYYQPTHPFCKPAETNPGGYWYYMGNGATVKFTITIDTPETLNKIVMKPGVSGRFSKKVTTNVYYGIEQVVTDDVKIVQATQFATPIEWSLTGL